MAVVREGIPVQSRVMPGNTTDTGTVEKVRTYLGGWNLRRAMFGASPGMNSEEDQADWPEPAANTFGTTWHQTGQTRDFYFPAVLVLRLLADFLGFR